MTAAGGLTSRADLSGYYAFPPNFAYSPGGGSRTQAFNNWSIFSNITWPAPAGGVASPTVSATISQLSLGSGEITNTPGHFNSATVLQVLSIAPASGLWSFDFSLGLRVTANGSSSGSYVINGTEFALTPGSGTVSGVFLNAGDVFGFRIFASQSSTTLPGGSAGLTVTNFSAPVPEPSGVTLLVVGVLTCFATGARRRHLTTRCS